MVILLLCTLSAGDVTPGFPGFSSPVVTPQASGPLGGSRAAGSAGDSGRSALARAREGLAHDRNWLLAGAAASGVLVALGGWSFHASATACPKGGGDGLGTGGCKISAFFEFVGGTTLVTVGGVGLAGSLIGARTVQNKIDTIDLTIVGWGAPTRGGGAVLGMVAVF